MQSVARAALAASAVLVIGMLAACGGSSGGSSGSTPVASKSCQQQFSPAAAAAGQDCTPTFHADCPADPSMSVTNDSTVNPCDGVAVSTGTATAGSLSSDYVVVKPSSGGGSGTVLALHWLDGNGATMVNRMRLSELAKGRDVTVVAPTAPGGTWGNDILAAPTSTVDERVALLDAVLAQVKAASAQAKAETVAAEAASTPRLIVAGLSGGGVMAFDYACAHAGTVTGVEIVAANITASGLSACKPGHSVASVQVHGTDDAVAPYNAVPGGLYAGVPATFQALYTNNGCDAAQLQSVNLPSPDTLVSGIVVQWDQSCTSKQGSALVTITGGGHAWPGMDRSFDQLPLNLYGPVSTGFDATLQAYDLLLYLGA